MRHLPTVLVVLALPAGIVGYAIGATLMSAISLPAGLGGILTLFVPLFIGGLFMVPFVIPFFDRMAKRDLAALERSKGSGTENVGKPPKAG